VRYYAPNTESDVVLACGCITSNWGALQVLGMAGEFQLCITHPNGDGRWGFQKILRKASLIEIYEWERYGKAAPKRRSTRAPNWMRAMSGESDKKASTKSRGESKGLF
jgi:hypothetical protein